MEYGHKPEGMQANQWTIECQCRHVAREVQKGNTKSERLAIFQCWSNTLPAVTEQCVREIWKDGVPMQKETNRENRKRFGKR